MDGFSASSSSRSIAIGDALRWWKVMGISCDVGSVGGVPPKEGFDTLLAKGVGFGQS